MATNRRKRTRVLTWQPEFNAVHWSIEHKGYLRVGLTDSTEPDREAVLLISERDVPYLLGKLKFYSERVPS